MTLPLMVSVDVKHHVYLPFMRFKKREGINLFFGSCCTVIVQELCESRGGRPGLSVLTSLLVSVDVKIY